MRYDPKTFEHRVPVDDTELDREISPPAKARSEGLPFPSGPYYAAPSTPDLPAAVGGLIATSYVSLIGALALATTGSALSTFAIIIAAFFIVVFFTVPRIFLGVEPKSGGRPRLDQFFREGMVTLTGHSSGPAALVQMLIVPVSLTLGVFAMGVIVAMNF